MNSSDDHQIETLTIVYSFLYEKRQLRVRSGMVSYSCVWHMRSWTVNSHLWEEIYLSHPSYLQDKTNHSIASRTEQNRTGNCFSNLSVLTWQQIVFCHTSSSSWTLEQKSLKEIFLFAQRKSYLCFQCFQLKIAL